MKFWVIELMVIVGLFHHLAGNEGFGGSYRGKGKLQRVELKMRERREMGEKRKNFDIYYFIL